MSPGHYGREQRCHRYAALVCALLVVACGDERAQATMAANARTRVTAEAWLGTWTGPEGTFLKLDGANGTYDVTIQNLDGARTFRGTAAGDAIVFERDGLQESISATDGAATGMKWLSDKVHCLTVRRGEGYCRD